MAEVKLTDIRKSFGSVEVIKGVDLDIKDREFVVFVGPSGCGKSTLLRLVAGLEDITSGEMSIDGRRVNDLPPSKRGISMVFQSYALYPHMTVHDNMAFGLKLAKESGETIEQRVNRAAEILQLGPLLGRMPKQLSGGQRQRVAIGRAIVRQPKVFLFDEPLSNLDAALRVQMRVELAELHESLSATMIYVTHDQVEAMTLADRIAVLNAGRLEQFGSPLDLYHRPRNTFVAGFIGSPKMNFIETEVESVSGGSATVALPGGGTITPAVKAGGLAEGARVTLGMRPEHITIGEGGDARIPGKVLVVERLGSETYTYVSLPDGSQITVKAPGEAKVSHGDEISVAVPAAECHLFDGDGISLERASAVSIRQ